MRHRIFIRAFVAAGVLGACTREATGPAPLTNRSALLAATAMPATRTAFEGFINFCESTPPEEVTVTPGGVLHVKAARNRNKWVTGNPLVDGFEENVVDANINLKTGDGLAHLVVTLMPDALDGTWQIEQTVTFRGGAPAGGRGVGHGTGELHGMTIKFTTEPAASGQSICNPDNVRAAVHGIIISPAISG